MIRVELLLCFVKFLVLISFKLHLFGVAFRAKNILSDILTCRTSFDRGTQNTLGNSFCPFTACHFRIIWNITQNWYLLTLFTIKYVSHWLEVRMTSKFFSDKIHKFYTSLLINRISASSHFPPPFTTPNFSSSTCVTTDEVYKLLSVSWH